MGRAMLIICAGTLISLGIISMSTSERSKNMTANAATYANQMTAKNAAHSAIQSAMQEINGKNHRTHSGDWAAEHDENNPWQPTINSSQISLHVEYLNDDWETNEYFEQDSLRMVSKAIYLNSYENEVISVYEVGAISSLVPPFDGAIQFPNGFGEFNTDGNAHGINGTDDDCGKSVPPITVGTKEAKEDLDNKIDNGDLNVDGEVELDESANYQPTDELIERLENSDNATTVTDNYSEQLGTADDPGVFFVDGDVKLTGQQKEGYGIMVIKNKEDTNMQYENEEGNTLDIGGNFEFNGLMIFENADAFKSGGTPDINGSVLIGDTDGETNIQMTMSGNAGISFSCEGEKYAKMGAADAVEQNRYTRVVTYE